MKKKAPKVHPSVELLSSLSTAVEKSVSQNAETGVLEMEVKAKELAASKARAEAENMLKSRELDMIEKKWNWRTKNNRGTKYADVARKGVVSAH
jgi:hypothetical protein